VTVSKKIPQTELAELQREKLRDWEHQIQSTIARADGKESGAVHVVNDVDLAGPVG